MADPADSAAIAGSRRPRASRRASSVSSVSIDTENKLARAAQSAQRLAQLSDVPRDDSTLDLFPDDPTRALVESMAIDLRQGTLSGFELPEAVRVAVEAAQEPNAASMPAATSATAARRAARSKGAAVVGAGQTVVVGEAAETQADGHDDPPADALMVGGGARMVDAAVNVEAAAVPARDVGAPAMDTVATPAAEIAAQTEEGGGPTPAARLAEAAAAAHAAKVETGAPVADPDASPAATNLDIPMPPARGLAESRVSASRRNAGADTAASPELDRARATAFADTVDALYGVMADQRRAAADLTRRMKWMLAIVAGALLVTVGVGVTQTLLLSRLARDAAAQQQRTAQMLQTQQAAFADMLARVASPAPEIVTVPAAVPHPAAPTPAPRHAAHGRRAHSPAR